MGSSAIAILGDTQRILTATALPCGVPVLIDAARLTTVTDIPDRLLMRPERTQLTAMQLHTFIQLSWRISTRPDGIQFGRSVCGILCYCDTG